MQRHRFTEKSKQEAVKLARQPGHAAKVAARQQAVGKSMQANSSNLFNEFTTEALGNAFNKSVVGK